MVEWVRVYDLREDLNRVRAMQDASLHRPDMGLLPDPHLVGTPAWWSAIKKGRPTAVTVEGTITRIWWGQDGCLAGVRAQLGRRRKVRMDSRGDYTRYVVGLRARAAYVVQRFKEGVQLARQGDPTTRLVLAIDIEHSDQRSPSDVPGPFGKQ